MTDRRVVRLAQLNAARSYNVMSECRIAVQKEDIDILTVSEPYIKGGKICGLPSEAVLKYKEVSSPMAAICVSTGKASMVYLEHLSTSHTCVA